jgi:hypothetical protein
VSERLKLAAFVFFAEQDGLWSWVGLVKREAVEGVGVAQGAGARGRVEVGACFTGEAEAVVAPLFLKNY